MSIQSEISERLWAGATYAYWDWGGACLDARSTACSGVGSSLSLELGRRFGPRQWAVQPYAGLGAGALGGHHPGELTAMGVAFLGLALDWRAVTVSLEARHQAQRMYSAYDGFTVLRLGAGLRLARE